MLKKLLILALLPTFFNIAAQTALPYFTGFDNPTQQAGWQEFRKGVTPAQFKWNYSGSKFYSSGQCLFHDYPFSENMPTDDWFVSPPFNFSAGGKLDSVRCSFYGWGTSSNFDTIAIYLLKGNADPGQAAGKILLKDFRGASYVNDSVWRITTNISIPITPGTSYIAFRYFNSFANWLDVKFDNLRLKSNSTVGITPAAEAIQEPAVYPNPAGELLNVLASPGAATGSMEIYNFAGQLIKKIDSAPGGPLNVSELSTGLYFLVINYTGGKQPERIRFEKY